MPLKFNCITVFIVFSLLLCRFAAVGGTTGVLTGTVQLEDGTVIADAVVTAAALTETKSVVTDTHGHFVFLSLPPDIYAVTASKNGYDTSTRSGVRITADNTRTLTLITRKIVLLAKVTVRPSNSLVRPGVVSDVFSINEAQAEKFALLGGGGNIDNIYSALATIPGVLVFPFQSGSGQLVNIRGGGIDQSGYEYDGIPVNRSFDNQPSTSGSTLGQRELQVYPGGGPANSSVQGLSGFINQVIKIGSYPGFAYVDAAVQSPNLYNKLNVEVGGALPDHRFSYFLGIGGYNYAPRVYDNFNGASLTPRLGFPIDVLACSADFTRDSSPACYNITKTGAALLGPGGYVLGPFNLFNTSLVADRETIANFHIRFPHHRDSGADDMQLLYSTSFGSTDLFSSFQDIGKPLWDYDAANGAGFVTNPPVFMSGLEYRGPVAAALRNGCPAPCGVIPYSFPSSNAAPGAMIPVAQRDGQSNGLGIVKLQYQHNIGSRAYFRVFAYSYYSWFFQNAPNSAGLGLTGPPVFGDYELTTHTRGGNATYVVQAGPKNLLTADLSYVTATTIRSNNTQYGNSFNAFAVLVDSKAPLSGYCFQASGAVGSCEPYFAGSPKGAQFLALRDVFSGGVPDVSGSVCDPGPASGLAAGPCQWLTVENGLQAIHNSVRPRFSAFALTDQINVSPKLHLELGGRVDRYQFTGADTAGPGRTFWFNAWNQNECVLNVPGSKPVDKIADLGLTTADQCSKAGNYLPATMYNISRPTFSYAVFEPRLGGTYTVNADNVLRFSYGKFAQPPLTAYVQYNALQQNLPALLSHRFNFYAYGFNAPGHALGPSLSYNADLSWEHHFAGSEVTLKLTPFLRTTRNQYEAFQLEINGLGSALPAGRQTTEGVEVEVQKGNFSQQGLTWQLSYGYTRKYTIFTSLPNGSTLLTFINNAIRQYNGYTSYCLSNAGDARCGIPSNGSQTAACYDSAGNADATCAAGEIANPYWNAPVQSLLDPTSKFFITRSVPNTYLSGDGTNGQPQVATLVVNYRAGRLALTPSLQLFSGGTYGAPLQAPGIDPASGCKALSGSVAGDSRYPYGAAGGAPYNATKCFGNIIIPDPYTHVFDTLSGFRNPSQLLMHLQLTLDASARVRYTIGATNLVDTCWGGSKEPWTLHSTNTTCSYGSTFVPYTGNFYNPDSQFQSAAQFPYIASPGLAPVTLTFQVKIKL